MPLMPPSSIDLTVNSEMSEVDFEFESNEVLEPFYGVDEQFVPKVRMTFNTLEDAAKFYKDYSKAASFSTRVRSTNKKENEIKNQLITCNREEKWKLKISPTEKTNPSAGLNCPARIYIHILKDIGVWIISNYGLVDNKWLSELYEDRHIWIPIYLDHHFWAGMRSTQRSKNMHAFFNKFITWNSSLIQFGAKREIIGCYRFSHCHTVCNKILHRSSISTCVHSPKVQGSPSTIQREGELHHKINQLRFRLFGIRSWRTISSSTFNKFAVTYDSIVAQVKCQCLLFESRGILCRRTLSVLSFERVTKVSLRYILKRWSKNVKRRHTHIKSSHDEPLLAPRSKRSDKLLNLFYAASVVQPNSNQYHGLVMNYQFRDPVARDKFLGE
ncbi:hypothetical protein Ahy_A04g017366 [Arachis hypogaea]|uniref:Protein FAR1-RELATED SEQUENCE n=1 Tax=Arachis hypogaea TaxID=3818 RepID=A0A445DAU5_ARAHY|nr:hypothetical protein Ahy_A04g017366 [Arachis hypogaea]